MHAGGDDRSPLSGLSGFGTIAKQAALVWACVAKRDIDWVKKCMEYEVVQTKR